MLKLHVPILIFSAGISQDKSSELVKVNWFGVGFSFNMFPSCTSLFELGLQKQHEPRVAGNTSTLNNTRTNPHKETHWQQSDMKETWGANLFCGFHWETYWKILWRRSPWSCGPIREGRWEIVIVHGGGCVVWSDFNASSSYIVWHSTTLNALNSEKRQHDQTLISFRISARLEFVKTWRESGARLTKEL